jgi:hypothetical protein
MTDRPIKIPGPDHPITIAPNPKRVVVTLGGRTIADTTRALTLQEAAYPAVQYIRRGCSAPTTRPIVPTRARRPTSASRSAASVR